MNYTFKNIKKLALGVMAFEGSEHLVNILTELRSLIDMVIIGYLETSYDNIPISDYDMGVINYLKETGLSDVNLLIKTDHTLELRHQETDKRNKIIEYAELHGCTHIIVIDADEYYTKENFLNALIEIDKNDYEQTYCQYINYYHDYNHYMVYPFKNGMHVPFVTKTCYRFNFNNTDFNHPSDPTRRYVRPKNEKGEYTVDYHIFGWNEIKMHHFSWIRRNIRNKINNWSSKKCFDDVFDKIEPAVWSFNNFKDDTTDVKILFNTPGNKITVAKFDKQYVFPKYSFEEIDKFVEPYITYRPKDIIILNMSTNACNGLFYTLEECCRNTWVKQIDKFGLSNIQYFSVYPGDSNKIDFDKRIIYVKDIQDKRDDVYQMLNRFIVACDLLKSNNIKYDYIIRTNTSTWLNLPAFNRFINQLSDDSLMFGFTFESAFWSQYNPYLSGQFLVLSNYTIDLLKYYITKENLLLVPDICDDVLFGTCYTSMQNNFNIPIPTYLKSLEGLYYDDIEDLDNLDDSLIAVQCKDFYADNEIRKIHDVLIMQNIEINFEKQSEKYKDGIYVTNYIKNNINNLCINIIPYTKTEWLKKDNIFHIESRFNNYYDFTNRNIELHNFITQLLKKAGYR